MAGWRGPGMSKMSVVQAVPGSRAERAARRAARDSDPPFSHTPARAKPYYYYYYFIYGQMSGLAEGPGGPGG